MRIALGAVAVALLAAACQDPEPRYLEAYGQFASGETIAFNETTDLMVEVDPATGGQSAIVRALDPTAQTFKGMEIQVDLTQVTTPGAYASSHTGEGPVQIRVHLPKAGGGPLDTEQYTADGNLDVLELPLAGNHRFAGSFTNVLVDYPDASLTITNGTFRGQL
jgi:hypothetical protein